MLGIVLGETAIAAVDVNLDVAATINAVAALVIAASALHRARSNKARIRSIERTARARPGDDED